MRTPQLTGEILYPSQRFGKCPTLSFFDRNYGLMVSESPDASEDMLSS